MKTQKKIELWDEEGADLKLHFESCNEFIDAQRLNTNVLVHCMAGVSRSSTIMIAYLMKTNNWKMDFSLNYVKSIRT